MVDLKVIIELGSSKLIKTSYGDTKELYDSIYNELEYITNQSNKFPGFIENGSCSFHNVDCQGKELYRWEKLGQLVDIFKSCLREYLNLLQIREDDVVVVGMWANRYPPDTYVGKHNHNYLNGENKTIIDALFYLKKDDKAGSLYIDIPEYGVYNANMNEGDIIVFQSSWDHWTDPNKSKSDKYVIGIELMVDNQGLKLNEI